MGKGFFHRYFEDYTEEKIPGSDGRMHIKRTYRGFWYAPQLTSGQRALRAAAYLLLYAGSLVLFILGAMQRTACNVAWYVAIATGLSLFSAVIELIPLLGCAFGKAEHRLPVSIRPQNLRALGAHHGRLHGRHRAAGDSGDAAGGRDAGAGRAPVCAFRPVPGGHRRDGKPRAL